MKLGLVQAAKMAQEMRLSPQMIQAMEILQLPLLGLQERIDAELESNPVLEISEKSDTDHIEMSAGDLNGTNFDDRGESDIVVDEKSNNADDFSRLDSMTQEFGDDFANPDAPSVSSYDAQEMSDRKLDAMANTAADDETLVDFLEDQWRFMDVSDDVSQAGKMIIENIDVDGYFRSDIAQLAELCDIDAADKLEVFNRALALIQTLEPLGVGAVDLKQCLLIQLVEKEKAGDDVKIAKQIVSQFLREVEHNRLPVIARKLSCSMDDINNAIDQIKKLNPHPGSLIGSHETQTITPDAVVWLNDDGELMVKMTNENIPELEVNPYYGQAAKDKSNDRETRTYLRDNIRSARTLMQAIAQRQNTIKRVTQEVFRVQKAFLEHGPEALKPLPMAEIADSVGIHVATVSRAVAEKYVETPRGIFPLRMFFSGGTKSADGQDLSWDAIKAKLKEIVDNENKAKPLSDEKLTQELKKAGLDVARRTIAKYREQLDIPPARLRKTF